MLAVEKNDYICMPICKNMSINEPIMLFLDFTYYIMGGDLEAQTQKLEG